MRYHNHLEYLFGSKAKIKILRTLSKFRDKKWTIRELADFNKMKHSVVIYALKDLQDANLINLEHYGKSNLVMLNKNSILNKILNVFELEASTFKELIKDIKGMLDNRVASCILFGSIVTKEERPSSDIDLLIITKNKNLTKDLVNKNQKYFSEKYGNIIRPQIFTKKQFNKNLSFIKTIGKNYIVIIGEDVLR